jgi:cyclic pyranopterin phosphate synthase
VAEARTKAETGVEMEALTAVSIACLTLFDMLKAIDRTMVVSGIAVVSKTGGKSGSWERT